MVFMEMSSWIFSALRQFFIDHDPLQIVVLGLEGAGKTTFLQKIKKPHQDIEVSIPTISFVVESLDARGLHFTSWDVGGSTKLRSLWYHYFQTMQMLIFVIDSTDRDQDHIENTREELHKLLWIDEMRDKPLLVLANKQDLPGAMTHQELSREYQLAGLIRTHIWYIQKTSMVSGEGIKEALDWIKSYIRRRSGY